MPEGRLAGFVDRMRSQGDNAFMAKFSMLLASALLATLSAISLNVMASGSSLAASLIYWCADRKGDQQYSAKPGPGCVPLVEKKGKAGDEHERSSPVEGASRDFKVENLQRDVSQFLKTYREFLECCKTDLSELGQIEKLAEEVGDLLASTQTQLSNYSLASRGVMLSEMIPAVAKARADLRTLRARLERISESSNQRPSDDFEEAGRAARIREIEESIDRDIQAPTLPPGPKTGTAIGIAPSAGPSIGKSPKTGAAIGNEGKTGQAIGASPKSSSEIGGSGPTGFAIGGTGKAGPAIGESTLNAESSSGVGSSLQRSTVGSSMSDSTVGSSLGTSSIGSSLQDSSVGSSFGGSSVGSSLPDQSR